jgi:RNA polymerase sigma factor (TIGR02999 family)
VRASTEARRQALAQAAAGDQAASQSLFELVYEDLRELARSRRARQARQDSLRTTELVHETWLRLYAGAEPTWENRRHFFGAAANAMRNILVDRARRRSALKRGEHRPEELHDDLPEFATEEPLTDVLALHLALEELEHEHERPTRVVVLRFFGGLSMEEIATVLDVSLATAERDWRFGRAWLQRAMEGGNARP